MNPYLSSSSLKRIAKGQLLGRYSSVIFIFLLHMLCLVSLQMLVSLVLAPTNIIKFILYYAALYLVYIVSGFFKKDTTSTAADKMARVLEAEAAATQKKAI